VRSTGGRRRGAPAPGSVTSSASPDRRAASLHHPARDGAFQGGFDLDLGNVERGTGNFPLFGERERKVAWNLTAPALSE